ncbi:MAG TPA: thioredoxin family protein [Flavobacteriales bacterium]|nr:thioredoxin family protein [Flavobacteriales bacterium]
MARTESTSIPLGFKAPDFSLVEPLTGLIRSLDELKSEKATVIIFMCNHCPYVIHVLDGIVALSNDYKSKGINFVAINANDVENYPDDSPEKMKELASKKKFSFPYLFDESQNVAKAYDAACTPEFHIFDKNLSCIYRGQLDDARPSNDVPVSGKDVRNALDNILEGRPVDLNQKPSIGCNIKWKS